MIYTQYNSITGQIVSYGNCENPSQLEDSNTKIILGVAYGQGWLDDNLVYHTIPTRPSIYHTWSPELKVWQDNRTLDTLKSQKWEKIKTSRDTYEFGGFTWDGSRFDSNSVSAQHIMGALQISSLSQDWSITWTLADNTSRVLTSQNMLAVGTSLANHVNSCHEYARLLRTQINACTNSEQLDAITWALE